MQVANCPWFRWWLDRTKEKEICWNQNDRSNRDSRWHKVVRQKLGLKKIDTIQSFESFFRSTSTSNFNLFNQLSKYHSDANAMRFPPQKVKSCKFGEGSGRGGRPRDCPFCLGWKERGGGGGGGGGGENNILAETGLTAAWTRRRSPDRTKQFSRNQDRGRVKPSLIAFPQYLQSHRRL